jgi:multisubunit Na+/H+ antiporter MnhE subunit
MTFASGSLIVFSTSAVTWVMLTAMLDRAELGLGLSEAAAVEVVELSGEFSY